MRILVIEDNELLLRQITASLERSGYVVDGATNGMDGWHLGDTEAYDAVILDRMLPDAGEGYDGLSVLKQWRQAGRNMPVIFLSALNRWSDKTEGIKAGADDYMAKPFEVEELLARIAAIIRRQVGHCSTEVSLNSIVLDTTTGHVTKSGFPVDLTALEYRALAFLMRNNSSIISKTKLTEHIYDMNFDCDSNVIEAVISRLRRKLGRDFIKTFRGRGYGLSQCQDQAA